MRPRGFRKTQFQQNARHLSVRLREIRIEIQRDFEFVHSLFQLAKLDIHRAQIIVGIRGIRFFADCRRIMIGGFRIFALPREDIAESHNAHRCNRDASATRR